MPWEKKAQGVQPQPAGTKPIASGLKKGLTLYPHQKRALVRLLENNGKLLMAHGVGSGKTISAIAGVEVLHDRGMATRTLVIVPAALRDNFAIKGVKKFTNRSVQIIGSEKGAVKQAVLGPKDYTVVSYETFIQDPEGIVQRSGADTLILDEFHRVRNPDGVTHDAIMRVRPMFRNVIGATGSVVSNDPVEIVPLLNIVAGQQVMDPREFKGRYERKIARSKGFFGGTQFITGMQRLPELGKRLGPFVDYVSSEELGEGKMPRRDVREIDVPMSPQQKDLYEYALGRAGILTAWKVRNNVPLTQQETSNLFAKIIQARRVSNDVSSMDKRVSLEQSSVQTPKVQRLLADTQKHLQKTPDGQVMLYSNLVRGGVDVLAAGLKQRGIPYGVFIGKGRTVEGLTATEGVRQKAVNEYNAGKLRVLVASGAGSEGLSLPNTTMVQTLDGHFNPEKILQAEARGRRIGGQAMRPEAQRVVRIRRYVSTLPEPGFLGRLFRLGKKETSADEWIYNTAARKHAKNRQLRTMLTAVKQPPKYVRKWQDENGEWRYEYPEGLAAPPTA